MLNLAFVGFRHGHINGLYTQAMENPDVSVVAAFEENEAARKAAEETLGVKFTHDSYEALLADPTIDAVAIGDYFGIRGARAIAALKAGKHVIADKPLCTSLKELNLIEKLSRQKGLKVGCMFDLRLNAWVEPVRDFIFSGKLGAIHQISFTAQHPLNWGTRPAWYFEDGKQGGTINDIGIHGIDLIPYITGLKFKKVIAARQWNAYAKLAPKFMDSAQFMAELDNGAGVMADVSYAAPSSCGFKLPQYWRFTIWGEKGVIECGGNTRPVISVALQGSDGPVELEVPEDTHQSLDVFVDPNASAEDKKPVRAQRQILDFFLADLASAPTPLNTATVIESSRTALTIQAAADRA
ncbi:MAG: Gfo/Idh/MocA family oxidoreductase [Clostridiaceae bacterium]|nr:Gfo/Idh/MocA family oxidoreductase [Clostridiaceae bacterium]MDY3285410.1 Gfo/Idh/MocA family oxidoreductase [Eubacteriales bacterium]